MALKRITKVAIGVAAAYGIYSALGYWALPAGLKWLAKGYASELTGRQCSIKEAHFNPWSLELTLKGVKMAGKDASEKPFAVGTLYTNIAGLSSIGRMGLVVDTLSIDRLEGEITINADGTTSFEDVVQNVRKRFPSEDKPDDKSGPGRFSLNNLSLTNSAFHILAPSHDVDENLTEINVGVPFIGSIGADREIYVKPEISLVDNGSPFSAHGETLPFKDTMATKMHAEIRDYDLPHLAAMSPVPLNAEVTSGKASITADITFARDLKGGENTILVGVSAEALDFAAAMKDEAGKKNAVSFKRLAIDSADIDVTARKADIANISLEAPNVAALRLEDGTLAWAHLVKESAPAKDAENGTQAQDSASSSQASAESEAKPEAEPFLWTVKSASITGGQLRFEDLAAHKALIEAKGLEASASNITMKPEETTAFDLSAKVLDGTLKAGGTLTLDALKGSVSLTADKLNLARVSGYAETVGMKLSGLASAKADADLALADSPLSAKVRGEASLSRFSLLREGAAPMEVKLDEARALQLEADYSDKLEIKAQRLSLTSPLFALPESSFSAAFGKAEAQALSLGWEGEEGKLALAAKGLALTESDVAAGNFDGKVSRFNTEGLEVGWNGQTEEARVQGSLFSARDTDITAGAFSATAGESRAQALAIDWHGKKQALSVGSRSIDIKQTAFKAEPVTGGADSVALNALSLSLEAAPGGKTAVKMADVKSAGASIEVAGDVPVKAAASALELKESALTLADTLAFSTASTEVEGLKSAVDIFAFNAGHARIGATAFSQGDAMSLTVTSADIEKAQSIAPVNAAHVSALSDTVTVRGLDWQSGSSGHSRLDSAEARSTAFEIEGTATKFGRVNSVSVTGVNAPATGTVNVARIAIDQPRYSVSRDDKGNLDIDPLLGKRASAEEAAKTRAEVKQKVEEAEKKAGREVGQPIRIGEFSVTGGALTFVDNSIKPAGKFRFERMNMQVKPVAYGGENTPSTLTMSALINGAAKLSVTGNGSPFVDKGKLVAQGSLTAVSMPFFSPYSTHYVSYPIQKGNLSMKSDITMTDKTRISVDNHVLIEQLGWGPYMPNETSTSLPVTLATALLTDSKGNLEFDLPISGDLADPEFSVSGLVLEGLKNLIIKVVAAPVNLLASIATLGQGGGQSRTIFLPYLSGQGRLTDQQKNTVSQIAKGMTSHPEWKLEITPVMSESGDLEALHQKTYSGLLRVVQSTQPESERSREKAVDALFALQFPDDKTTSSLAGKEAKLYDAVKPDFGNMLNLADSRSRRLAREITEAGVPAERLFITAPEHDKKGTLGGVRLKFYK